MSENIIQKIKIQNTEYELGTTIDNVNGLQDALNSKSDTGHTHSAADIGALPADTVIPTVPTNVSAFTNDAGYLTEHQSLDGLATESYVDTQIAAIPTPDVSGQINTHNTAIDAHNDIRLLVDGLTTRLNTLANSDDTTLDQMSEIVAYIKSNKSLIDGITTNKVNVSDIINNLTTNVDNKPLSSAQGVALKALIDAIIVPTKLSQLTNDSGFITGYTETDPTVPSWAKQPSKPSYTAAEVGALPVDTAIPSIEGLASEEYVNEAIGLVLPSVTTENNGEFLRVVNGAWAATSVPRAEEAEF